MSQFELISQFTGGLNVNCKWIGKDNVIIILCVNL